MFGLVSASSVAAAHEAAGKRAGRGVPAETEQPLPDASLGEGGDVSESDVTVTVIGPPAEARTASTTVVTARELAAVPRRNAEDALRLAPGVTLVQHGSEGKGYQFFMRGFDAAHGADLEVTVEGFPVNEWSNIHAQGYLDLGFVIPEVIESVRIVKGPFTLGQGAFAMAGSAEYHLGVPEELRGARIAYTLGTTNRHRAVTTYGPEGGSGHDFVASETLYDGGFGPNRSLARGAVLGRATLADSERHGRLSVLGAGYVARFELPSPLRDDDLAAGRVGFYDGYEPGGRGASVRALTALSYERRRGSGELRARAHAAFRRLELLENFTGHLLDPVHGDFRSQRQDAFGFGAAVSYLDRLTSTLDAVLGLGVRGDVLDQRQDHVTASEVVLSRERALSGVQMLTHALAGLVFRPAPELRVDGGARLDLAHFDVRDGLAGDARGTGTHAALSPRAILEWKALDSLRLLAAYGRGFRPPEARSFSSFTPARVGLSEELQTGVGPDMTVADSVELGGRWQPSRAFHLQLSGFATFIAREASFDHVSGTHLELNSTRRIGVEAALRSRPLEWLELRTDATWVDARFVESQNPVPLAPRLFGRARAALGGERGLCGGLSLFAVAPRPLPHGATGATLTQLDATAGYDFGSVRLDLELENVLGQQIREGEFHFASHFRPSEPPSDLPVIHVFPGPPRNARLTLTAVY